MIPDSWSIINNTTNTIKFSGNDANVSILGETLRKVRTEPLVNYPTLTTSGLSFTLTDGSCTYM